MQREVAGAIAGMRAASAEHQRPVAAHAASAPPQHVEVDVRFEPCDVAAQPDRPGECAPQRKMRDPSGEPIERQRVGADVGGDPEDVGAGVEPDDAADDAHGTVAVVMPERATEHRVLEGAGQRSARIQLALEIERRDEPADGGDVEARSRHRERLKGEIFPRHIDLPLAVDLAFGPAGNQRVAE